MIKKCFPRIIDTNIKTRRLGYIVALIELLGNNFLLVDDVIRRLELWAKEHQRYLEKHFSKSGSITISSRHYPAIRYIHLAEKLRLIKLSRNGCAVTKIGQPILYLTKCKRSPFELSDEQKCYFLKRILENDYDYFFPFLKLLKRMNKTKEIFSSFKVSVLEHLEMKSKRIGDILKSSDLRKRQKLMMAWTEEEKYLEHLIYPRLDWLIDLGLIKYDKYKVRIYELTNNSLSFLEELEKTQEIEDLDIWLEEQYYKIFSKYFIKRESIFFGALKEEERFKYVKDLLEDSFTKFSPSCLPFRHISANTFLEYSCTKLVGKGIWASFSQLKEILKQLPGYRFQWQPMMHDGFVMRD